MAENYSISVVLDDALLVETEPMREKPRPERLETDQSLRDERQRSDGLIRAQQAASEAIADEVVVRARQQADTVLETARGEVNDALDSVGAGAAIRGAVAERRELADESLQDERDEADDALSRERTNNARAWLASLPLEREKTDLDLLTERVRSDSALANRDDFLGIVSHDLRNLLSGIMLQTNLQTRRARALPEGGPQVVEGMRQIERYVARMNRLIGDLVDVVSIDAGKLALRRERHDAASLLHEAADSFALQATQKALAVEVEAERAVVADFDSDRILQVLANLLGNAIKFTASHGAIRMGVEQTPDAVLFTVKDDGIGIESALIGSIFERFWQVREGDGRGLGLGLYISRCIVVAHGGRIWAESEPGSGSTFRFTIPTGC
ncbi:sensor histidine kinase [Nannocystaceae bacterium ST9]